MPPRGYATSNNEVVRRARAFVNAELLSSLFLGAL